MIPYEKRYECGLPGVNGGYFENNKFLFGATCYGKKPLNTEKDKEHELMNQLVSAKNHNEYERLRDVSDYDVLPFNKDRWSQ